MAVTLVAPPEDLRGQCGVREAGPSTTEAGRSPEAREGAERAGSVRAEGACISSWPEGRGGDGAGGAGVTWGLSFYASDTTVSCSQGLGPLWWGQSPPRATSQQPPSAPPVEPGAGPHLWRCCLLVLEFSCRSARPPGLPMGPPAPSLRQPQPSPHTTARVP